jgi:small-conductance mechanosensitive channel
MANELRTEVEQVKKQQDVKRALKQASSVQPAGEPKAETKDKVVLSTHAIVLLVLGVFYNVLQLSLFGFAGLHPHLIELFQRLDLAAMGIVFTLAIAKVGDVYLIGRIDSPVSRYNLRRVAKLALGLLMVFLIVSAVIHNWYTTVAALSLFSIVLGLAVQTPVTSFLGWIYILVRAPYRVGDRIKVGDATGDVIDVSYLDTTLWEFGGDFLSTDHPSGRVIKFPNSKILSSTVYNYTWPLFPYVWNEIKFSVAYNSDLDFISETMQRLAAEEVGEHMMEQVRIYREILAQTPVNQLEVREYPSVLFRVNANTWLDAIVRYLVHPKEAGRVKTHLIKKLLAELNNAPDRVMFPKGDAR